MKTTLIFLLLLTPPALGADSWRMYRCVGDQGEPIFSDRHIGTECVEIQVRDNGKPTRG